MSMQENRETNCSSCGKTRQKFDIFTTKCIKHSYKLCNICIRKKKQCPDCSSEKNGDRSGQYIQQQKSEGRPTATNGEYKSQASIREARIKDEQLKELRTVMEKIEKEKNELKFKVINLERERSQKDVQIRNMQIEMYKSKDLINQKVDALRESHAKEINQLKTTYEKDLNKLSQKTQKQFKQQIVTLNKEKEELKKNIQIQKKQLQKLSDLQKDLLKTNFENEKQKLVIQMQNKIVQQKSKGLDRQKQMNAQFEQKMKVNKAKYQAQLQELKSKAETQKQQLKSAFINQKDSLQKNHHQQKNQLQSKLLAQRHQMLQSHERQKGHIQGTFFQEKSGLEEIIQLQNRELTTTVRNLTDQKEKLKNELLNMQNEFNLNQSDFQRIIVEKSRQVDRINQERISLLKYIEQHGQSLEKNKREIDDFDRYIEKSNNHIVSQFKSLDQTYKQPTPQKLKQLHLAITQHKEIIESSRHPEMVSIIHQKQAILNNYVVDQMKKFDGELNNIDMRDFTYIDTEQGKKLKRVIQKVDLLQSLGNQNLNESLQIHYLPKLYEKIKIILSKSNQKISALNNEVNQFEQIKEIDQFYEFKGLLGKDFKGHEESCQKQYQEIDQSINASFNRFQQTYNIIIENKPTDKLEDYTGKADELKKFIQIIHYCKSYKKYSYNLENHLNMTLPQVKTSVLGVLNKIKKQLKVKLQTLMQSRGYYECYIYQKIFKRLKVFDEILTKQQNSYYSFNFSQLYNKILNFLKILKEEKLNLSDVIIADQKINMDDLKRQYENIAFDQSVRNRYLYKIKSVLQNRKNTISKITNNAIISERHLEQYQLYNKEAHELKNIKQINEMPQIDDQLVTIREKMPVILTFLQYRFKQYYENSFEFKELEETNRNIKYHHEFQEFSQRQFPEQHTQFKQSILSQKFTSLPEPASEQQSMFNLLLRLNTSNRAILQQLISNPDEPLKDDHFEFFTNITTHLSKTNGTKIQNKLHKSILESVGQLEAKEWPEGDVSSQSERMLLSKLNKLQNKQIAYYREIITLHKNKIIEERQKLINSEKRKLKQDNFENLEQFLIETKKHESGNTKFYKLYINILEDYSNYSYDNIANDNEKKAHFLHKLYKLNHEESPKIVKDIFKSKEHKIYFCRPDLMSIRSNIPTIEHFQGQNEANVNKASQTMVDIFKLYSIFKNHEEKSLLEDREKQKFHQEIELIKEDLINNYNNLCKSLEYERMFDQKCDHKKLFLQLIKIQIYSKLMKKIQNVSPHHEYYNIKGKYEQITRKINTKIQKIFEQVKHFRYYKQELKMQYDNNNFLYQHLRKIENIVQIFKQIKYKVYKFDDYLKNNYLQNLNLKDINYKEIIRIVEMSWIKQYAVIKREIYEMFHTHQMEIVLKYKMILHEKEIVKNQNLLSFNEIIKEEYDFKKIVIQQLMEIQSKLQGQMQNLERQNQTFIFTIKNMEISKRQYIQTEKDKVKAKYQKLITEVKNSFQQIDDEQVRQQKIQSQINTLSSQLKAQEQSIFNQQTGKTQNFRKKFTYKAQKYITKIFEHIMIVKKIQSNFDIEIQELCKKIILKIQSQMDRFDSHLKNIFVMFVKKSKNSDLIMNASSMNIFKQINEEQFKQNTKAMNDIHQIIKKCPQLADNSVVSTEMIQAYEIYDREIQRVEKQFYQNKSENFVVQLIKETKAQVKQLSPSVVIARIFAVYSIYKCIDSHQQEITFDGNPHIAQVVSILLLIDARNQKNAKLDSRLIEVKTGQGKSRVLGGLNCYLALHGYDVYCGCYSSYLSKRDQEEFHSLFVRFGVNNMITYGPFSEHCQSVFNESNKHNFKEVTKKVLLNEKLSQAQLDYLERLNKLLKRESKALRILVIDEVDVFFDQNYFGQLYTPGVAIDSPEVKQLIKFIWENHTDPKLNKLVFQSEEYKNLVNLYPHLNQLIKNQVQSMIYACNNYNVHPYEIRNNQIQYVDNDSVNQKLNFGYSTAFASCFQYERGKISEFNYNKNTNISLIIGKFSYAELPKYFDHILGVSGTVEAMSDFRKQIMKKDYNIKDIYALPSIYGDSHRKIYGFHSCERQNYLNYLLTRINDVRKQQRPILVFFQTEKQLNIVSNSPQFAQFTTNIYKINEKMPPEMRNPLINYAGSRNRITLISSAFSRGTDFTVFDTEINEKGGMHVIQTYISKNESDFIQILGRTGRQGKNGSFEVIVKKQELTKNGIPLADDKELFNHIQESWKKNDIMHGRELSKSIENAKVQHMITFDVVGSLSKQNSKLVGTVMKLNYNQIKNETIRSVIAIDGTGSMGAALNAVFSILNDTISRTQEIISLKMPNVSFEHKIMIYRNYNIKPKERILQQSNFSKDPGYLQAFMSSIKPEGGLGNQAQQILFYQIGNITEFDNVDQIIIIGDAPANNYDQMVKHRKKFHGEKQWITKYPLLDSIQQYSETVKRQKIPIHSFYILRRREEEQSINWDRSVKTHFETLSQRSDGLVDELNIRDQQRAKVQLTDFISERVLNLVGGRDLVALYSQMYSKRYV